MDRNLQLRNDLNRNSFDLLKIDMGTALTFAKIAAGADAGSEKRARNQANARKAYDAIQHLRTNVEMTAEQDQELDKGLGQLKSALQELGEKF